MRASFRFLSCCAYAHFLYFCFCFLSVRESEIQFNSQSFLFCFSLVLVKADNTEKRIKGEELIEIKSS